MRVSLIAVGRLRSGPEGPMAADYMARAALAGKALGLHPIELIEVEGKPAGDQRKEAEALARATPEGGKIVLLDERGADLGSRTLAEKIAQWRDEGCSTLSFWIGGADGFAPAARDAATERMAFGRWTWPHRLVRVMAAEQIYRAVTILSHSPYHRD